MKKAVFGAFVAIQLTLIWFAVAQTAPEVPAQAKGAAGLTVSPTVLDFGVVGVGTDKELPLTVQNNGPVKLKGTISVKGPFRVKGKSSCMYSLGSGKSESLKVQYSPTAEGTNNQAIEIEFAGGGSAIVPVTGWARMRPQPPGGLRVTDSARAAAPQGNSGAPRLTGARPQPPGNLRIVEARVTKELVRRANFIFYYASDKDSYVLEPPLFDGPPQAKKDERFPIPCSRADVHGAASNVKVRELAIVLLRVYWDPRSFLPKEQDKARTGAATAKVEEVTAQARSWEEQDKQKWWNELKALGYNQIVFARIGGNLVEPVGCQILPGPQTLAMSPGK